MRVEKEENISLASRSRTFNFITNHNKTFPAALRLSEQCFNGVSLLLLHSFQPGNELFHGFSYLNLVSGGEFIPHRFYTLNELSLTCKRAVMSTLVDLAFHTTPKVKI